jgi:hypothetical protein
MGKALKIHVSSCYLSDHPDENMSAWLNDFQKALVYLLERILRSEVQLTNTKDGLDEDKDVVVLIISGQAMASGKCKEEMQLIERHVKDNSRHAFRVFLEHVYPLAMSGELGQTPAFNFYQVDKNFISEAFMPGKGLNFWLKLLDLAYDILFKCCPDRAPGLKHGDGHNVVYLAETVPGQEHNRDVLRRELVLNGYRVLPEKKLPAEYNALKQEVLANLEKAFLSIHVIGNEYGVHVEGGDQSLVDLQNQFAAQLIQKGGDKSRPLYRLIWLPYQLNITDEEQYKFIEQVKRDAMTLAGAEIIQSPIEEMKNIIQYKIEKFFHFHPSNMSDASSVPLVYLICDKNDLELGHSIENMLKENGFRVIMPEFNNQNLNIVNKHRQNLVSCDSVLIFYGNENDQWFKSKMKDLLKSPGYGRDISFHAKAVLSVPEIPEMAPSFFEGVDIFQFDGKNLKENLLGFIEKARNGNTAGNG